MRDLGSRDNRLNRALRLLAVIALSVALAAVAIWLLSRVRAVAIILLAAVFFAYLVYPAVQLFQRRLPRWLAIALVYVSLALVVGGIGSFLVPRIAHESQMLARDFPGLVNQAQQAVLNANTLVMASVPLEARETAAKTITEIASASAKESSMLAGQALTILLNVASLATVVVIVPIVAFYILLDSERIGAGFLRLFPASSRATVAATFRDIDRVLAGFVRGQIIVGAIVAVLITTMLLILHIRYALLIGVFVGVVDLIPYVGAVAGAIPAVLIAAFTHGLVWALIVAAAFVVVYQLEGHIIAPNIVGQRVGLTPLMVIVAVLTGAELGGIGGMFIAVPTAGILRVLWRRFMLPSDELEIVPAATAVAPLAPAPADPKVPAETGS